MMTEYGSLAAFQIEELARRVPDRKECDFEKDGILYCGECGDPKQAWIDWIPDEDGHTEKRLVTVMCRCEQERYEAEEEEIRREQFTLNLRAMREAYGLLIPESDKIRFAMDDAPNTPIARTCRRYVDKWDVMRKDSIGIVLFGNKGTGKTFYAACIANEIAETRRIPTLIVTTAALVGVMHGKQERAEIIEHLNHFALLVLDDLGAERETSYGAEVLYSVIDARYRSGLPLIVTTNMDVKDMENESDPMRSRVYDRVLEMCAIPLEVIGESRRSGIAERRRALAREILGGKQR